jgi:hypothetical protein
LRSEVDLGGAGAVAVIGAAGVIIVKSDIEIHFTVVKCVFRVD